MKRALCATKGKVYVVIYSARWLEKFFSCFTLPSYLPPQLPLSSCRLPLLLRGRRSISARKVSLLPSFSDFQSSVKTTKRGRLEISTCYASGNCIKIKEEKTKTLHSSARLVCKHSEEEEIDWAIKIRRKTWTRRHPTAEFVMIRRLARQWIEKRRTVYANDVEWAMSEFGIYFRKQIDELGMNIIGSIRI